MTVTPKPRTSPMFPSISILDLTKQGVYTRSLMRYWYSAPEFKHPAPRYEYVLRIPDTTTVYVIPVTRVQAAQIVAHHA